MVATFLADERFTHLMWIDGDIGFGAADVLRLLRADRPIAAGIYPMKTDGWPRGGIPRELPAGTTREAFLARFASYPVNMNIHAHRPDKDGFVEATDVPTGFMMIRRDVLVELARVSPHLRYTPYKRDLTREATDHTADFHYTFFDTMIDPETGFYLSEDYAFCRRVAAIGVRPVVDTRSRLSHQGIAKFEGDFGRSLQWLREQAAVSAAADTR
jgi:hypothetical protein